MGGAAVWEDFLGGLSLREASTQNCAIIKDRIILPISVPLNRDLLSNAIAITSSYLCLSVVSPFLLLLSPILIIGSQNRLAITLVLRVSGPSVVFRLPLSPSPQLPFSYTQSSPLSPLFPCKSTVAKL